MNRLALILPFGAQGLVMAWDEFYFHARRGLNRWERLGHPLDTLSYLACLSILAFVPPTPLALWIYAACGVFSCLLITKDEWVHARECKPAEHWLHSLLFVLHPICLFSAGCFWSELRDVPAMRTAFLGFLATIFIYMLYQFFYWNFRARDSRAYT